VEATIGANAYQNSRVNQWTTSVVEQCLSQLSKLGKPFKYIGTYAAAVKQIYYDGSLAVWGWY